MAVFKVHDSPLGHKPQIALSGLWTNMVGYCERVKLEYEAELLRSPAVDTTGKRKKTREEIRREAGRRAWSHMAHLYVSNQQQELARVLRAVEDSGRAAEESLRAAAHHVELEPEPSLEIIENGHFRLCSHELFEALGEPAALRFGTLRFSTYHTDALDADGHPMLHTAVDMALNNSFFVAHSHDSHQGVEGPHTEFSVPKSPQTTNRAIRTKKVEDGSSHATFPVYDSWLLITFLGNGRVKVEIPIELCADAYGGILRGRTDHDVVFWGEFVEDAPPY